MLQLLSYLIDPQFVGAVLAAVAAAATAFTLLQPFLEPNRLAQRMKSVGEERDRIRLRERDRLNQRGNLRQQPKAYMKRVVERFKLDNWLATEDAKNRLMMAGYRGPQAETAFLFFRLVMPLGFLVLAVFYLFVLQVLNQPFSIRLLIVIAATYGGVKAPEIFLKNQTDKRQAQIRKNWPDALDLLLICVESGMAIELAFRRVGVEMANQSIVLAEELALTTAELSYLTDRRVAYDNLAIRTGLDSVKAVCTALIQAERYGTPIGQALRVLAQESRDQRMNEAEKKAAALPPKLTVPMILFFLPVLFVVILTPAMVQVFAAK
ncbi:type II secretion system protein [Methylobacterium sp. 4-46]|uniref:type II secretion system F family protein n=1 Tax=unclassified Methylobacterium TaxID=2615210 RepID=UPI000152C8C9|nr:MULTISPECIES: type II secretion system F family protein [Methylobacterium]ACA16837.1 type II secretion system protein [Methylobacterium sp. 4-46]WFT82530.1 type II secretion system F family protein [Methylobacterium nodulans]